jgi:DNA invertase Pin-like site-specific DNA recombinase
MNEGYNYTNKRYIALVRASDATEGTTSTQAQLAMLHARAAELKMIPMAEIILDGVTGSMPGKRTDMDELLRRKKEQNDFEVLVVQRLDRLTRSGPNHGAWFEYECQRAGIRLLIVGDDIPEGRYAATIKSLKYQAAQEQAFSISQRSTQGYQLALEEGRVTTSSHTPYACWRLYLSAEGKPLHIIRDLGDGTQQKLHPQTHEVIDTYGQAGGGAKGHYRKQKQEKVLLMPGDAHEIAVIRTIFDLHFRQGWGGKRIADHLNRQGTPSPCGRQWSQRQVEVLYNNEVYTGRSVGNRQSSGIYHSRNHAAPKPTNIDPSIHATARTIPVQLRPRGEWFIVEQPLLKELLGDEQLRHLAMEAQDRYWQHQADPDRPKLSKSKHKTSDYLLSGLLVAKQDGGPLVGVLCGRVGRKVRYYRHRRGRTGYLKGSVYNKMIHAETVEKASINAVKATLLDTENLREKLLKLVEANTNAVANVDLDDLLAQREKLKRRTQLIVATLDDDTLADAQHELEKLKAQRRMLDEQIKAAHASKATPKADAEGAVERLLGTLEKFFGEASSSMPNHLLKKWLAAMVSKVVVDMETKDIEIHVELPIEMLESAFSAEEAMRLVTTSASPSSYQTHPTAFTLIALVECQFQKASNSVCYACTRAAA